MESVDYKRPAHGRTTAMALSLCLLAAPLALFLDGLSSGVVLDNASGVTGGRPYLALPESLNAGASITAPLTFSNPARAVIAYTPKLFQGNF